MISRMTIMATGVVGVLAVPEPAQAYDMDCKVILCLAGGFPSGCADAHSYMMDRLKRLKPPFGPCSTETAPGEGGGGRTYTVPVRLFTRDDPYRCVAWRDGRDLTCTAWEGGWRERVIGMRIPASRNGTAEPFATEYVWHRRRLPRETAGGDQGDK